MPVSVGGHELPLNEEEDRCVCYLGLFGGLCAMCTFGLSLIPFCCYVHKLDTKYSQPRPMGYPNPYPRREPDEEHFIPRRAAYGSYDVFILPKAPPKAMGDEKVQVLLG